MLYDSMCIGYIYLIDIYTMLVDTPWIVGSRYPLSHCIQPAAGAAKGHGIEHAVVCQKMHIIFMCILLLLFILLIEH